MTDDELLLIYGSMKKFVDSMAVRERVLDQKTAELGAAIAELQQLPGTLGEQTSQYIAFGVKHSVRDDFERPIAEAVKGPLAELSRQSYNASEAMRQLRDASLHQTWQWMASLVSFGLVLGITGSYFFHRDIVRIDDELDGVRQQMVEPVMPVPETKQGTVPSKTHHGHTGTPPATP